MRTVRVIYEYYPESWVAESPDVPGWMAFGDSYQEVRELAREGIPFFAEEEVSLVEVGIRFSRSKFPTSSVGMDFKQTRLFAGQSGELDRTLRRRPATKVGPQPIPA